MRHIPKVLALMALTGPLTLLTLSAAAQEDENREAKKGPNVLSPEKARNVKPGTTAKQVSDLSLAYTLAAYGRKHNSPVALLAAARIVAKIPAVQAKEKPETLPEKGGEANGETRKTAKAPDNTVKGLLAAARRMSKNDEHIEVLAKRVENLVEEARGAVDGPRVQSLTLPVGQFDKFTVTFRGNEEARVAVVAAIGNLRVLCYDRNRNPVGQPINTGVGVLYTWVPIFTDPFYIEVHNSGTGPATYSIAWN